MEEIVTVKKKRNTRSYKSLVNVLEYEKETIESELYKAKNTISHLRNRIEYLENEMKVMKNKIEEDEIGKENSRLKLENRILKGKVSRLASQLVFYVNEEYGEYAEEGKEK